MLIIYPGKEDRESIIITRDSSDPHATKNISVKRSVS